MFMVTSLFYLTKQKSVNPPAVSDQNCILCCSALLISPDVIIGGRSKPFFK